MFFIATVTGAAQMVLLHAVTIATARTAAWRSESRHATVDWQSTIVRIHTRLQEMLAEEVDTEERRRLARKLLYLYAPRAHRLGMSAVRDEVGDAAFAALAPARSLRLAAYVSASRPVGAKSMDAVQRLIEDVVQPTLRTSLWTQRRTKAIHSVAAKMERCAIDRVESVYDLFGMRVILCTPSERSCHKALVLLRRQNATVDLLRDYVLAPKPNGYRSLHAIVTMPAGVPIELQVRTSAMHADAQHGAAAHWRYKRRSSRLLEDA